MVNGIVEVRFDPATNAGAAVVRSDVVLYLEVQHKIVLHSSLSSDLACDWSSPLARPAEVHPAA